MAHSDPYWYAGTGGYTRGRPLWTDLPDLTTPATEELAGNRWDQAIYDLKKLAATPDDFGAAADGTTDDYAAIQRALTASPLVCFRPGKTYKCNSPLAYVSGQFLHGYGSARLDFSGCASNASFLSATGTLGTSAPLTGNTTVNGSTLAFAAGSESNFAVGDYVLVGSNAYFEDRTALYGAGTGQKIGEVAKVSALGSGSMTLRAPLAGGFTDDAGAATLTYKTADSAFVRKITPVTNVLIDGLTIAGTQGSGSGGQIGVGATYARHIVVRNTSFEHIATSGISFLSVLAGLVDGCEFVDHWDVGSGYAVAIGDASQDCTVRACHAAEMRHGFTTTSTINSFGVTRRITVDGVQVYDTVNAGDGLDTHAAAEDIRFVNCDVYGAAEHGINVECASATIDNCTVKKAQKAGVNLVNFTFARPRHKVENSLIEDCGITSFSGIRVRNNQGTTSGRLQGSVKIQNNEVLNQGADVAIDIEAHASYPLERVKVGGNTTENHNDAHGGIYLINCARPSVVDNHVERCQANQDGIRLNACTKPAVNGNVVNYPSLGTGVGISFIAVTGGAVGDNTVTNAGTGIKFDNACSYIVAEGNDVKGCTTPLSVGTGTGHVYQTAAADAYNRT